MFEVRVYKYDSTQEENDYRGEDFSAYVLQGSQITEDITQELDTSEITLAGLPFEKAFDPETKFVVDIVELYSTGEEEIMQTLNLCVAVDVVQKPILSDDSYFDHHISFIEPSVIAQKRLVDNISATYKLKDVSLEEIPAIPDERQELYITSSIFTPNRNFERSSYTSFGTTYSRSYWGKYFEQEGEVAILNSNNEEYNFTYENLENFKSGDKYFAKFRVPKLAIYAGKEGTRDFIKIGYASIDYTIEEFALTDLYNPLRTIKGKFISNSNLYNSQVFMPYVLTGTAGISNTEWLIEGQDTRQVGGTNEVYWGARKYTETSANTPTYITDLIEVFPDRQYKVTISLHEFDDSISSNYVFGKWTKSPTQWYLVDTGQSITHPAGEGAYMTLNQTSGSAYFITYKFDTLKKIVYSSSTPYSALALLQKAIINSGLHEKQEGVYIADINDSNNTFYIDPLFRDKLSATLIIENFYNQKNLWEIMIEVGNYIHAIPELKFGINDRFLITFNELGRTDEKEDKGTKVSIFNSRSIEDYISATSSYITNMVQLGGYIEEWVVPKTTNTQLLVYNDTGEIVLSKPIIELLKIEVRDNETGEIRDLTDYIFEENVYKTLAIDYQVVPNRGLALFYTLGDNKIIGGSYQLPQAKTNIYSDYSLKKVIYSAFKGYPVIAPQPTYGYWTDIQVNNYSFFVRYRTKDSVRQNHTRPDIRKYLCNSKHDRYPQHNQFNNQTDVVVDSIKFGNNMFGKLIKTGNLSYQVWEWHDNWSDVKHKGELYRVGGDLYYVAKATHYAHSSYILSQVEYSKDYNELSKIIGIPSEPRFYEISEQSLIWRDFAIDDLLLLTDDPTKIDSKSNYLFNCDHLADLMFGTGTDFAKYAITVYKGDKDGNKYDQTTGQPNLYIEVINPVNAYSSENTLTYEWDMIDNYSAGDKVIDSDMGAYKSLRAVQYTDIYGRAALFDFYILGDIITSQKPTLSADEIRSFPESPISTKQGEERPFIGDYDILATNVKKYNTNFNGRGIGLLKDCREALSINYNLELVTTSDTFVLSPYIFLPKKENLSIVLLSDEVNKLSTGYIDNSKIITPIARDGQELPQKFDFSVDKVSEKNEWGKDVVSYFGIDFAEILFNVADGHFTGADGYDRIKAIAVFCNVSLDTGNDTQAPMIPSKTQFVFARNIPENWTREQATAKVYFGAPNKYKVFTNRQ